MSIINNFNVHVCDMARMIVVVVERRVYEDEQVTEKNLFDSKPKNNIETFKRVSQRRKIYILTHTPFRSSDYILPEKQVHSIPMITTATCFQAHSHITTAHTHIAILTLFSSPFPTLISFPLISACFTNLRHKGTASLLTSNKP